MSHLYVCRFSSGHIKVGRSIDPESRVAQHAERVACVGVELVEYRTFACTGDVGVAEAALIEKCDAECERRLKSEWFEGLSFESVCAWCGDIASTPFADRGLRPVQVACAMLGGPAKLAAALDCSVQAVCFWRDGQRRIPAERCIEIERITQGAVRCEELRPDVNWAVLRGTGVADHV